MGPSSTTMTTHQPPFVATTPTHTPTPTEEEENNDVINTGERVGVMVVLDKKKMEEEEEREKKEDFVKAVDDLLELVTKKFGRISRDIIGKSTSYLPTPISGGGGFFSPSFFSRWRGEGVLFSFSFVCFPDSCLFIFLFFSG